MYLLVDVTIDSGEVVKLKQDRKTIEGPNWREFLANPGKII